MTYTLGHGVPPKMYIDEGVFHGIGVHDCMHMHDCGIRADTYIWIRDMDGRWYPWSSGTYCSR